MSKTRFFHPDDLTAIRESCDWRKLLDDLGVRADVKRCAEGEFWGFSPFSPEEKTASFHMKEPGVWYDWSTHAIAPGRDKPGGGVIELVQAVHATRGRIMKLNEATAWLLDHGHARLEGGERKASSGDEEKENAPITVDLAPKLTGDHPSFWDRGISPEACRYLCCGYYPAKRGSLAERAVFQVGGVIDGARVVLSHMGRATTQEQEGKGKWRFYRGFNPSLELYNQDNLHLDPEACAQVHETGGIVLVEGAFDVAKCVEAGIKNVVASFGARLSDHQAEKLRETGARVTVFYDRDRAGQKASHEALALLAEYGVEASGFDWDQSFATSGRAAKSIPESIYDPCDCTTGQLKWLRRQGLL